MGRQVLRPVLAFDPGKMTGWARLHAGESFQSGEQPLDHVLHFVFETLKQEFKPVLICEDFVVTMETLKKSRQMYSTEGIGALRFLANEYQCEFILQTPAAAKRFSTNEKLKRIGWWNPGKNHANDAARHLLLYGVSNGLISARQFMGDHANS